MIKVLIGILIKCDKCDKSCEFGEYLDYRNCRKRLVDKLVDKCNENIDKKKLCSIKLIYNSYLNDYEKICSSCIVYTILLVIFFILSIIISSAFIYFHWSFKIKYIETTIY